MSDRALAIAHDAKQKELHEMMAGVWKVTDKIEA
jgi:hypothetical protein